MTPSHPLPATTHNYALNLIMHCNLYPVTYTELRLHKYLGEKKTFAPEVKHREVVLN